MARRFLAFVAAVTSSKFARAGPRSAENVILKLRGDYSRAIGNLVHNLNITCDGTQGGASILAAGESYETRGQEITANVVRDIGIDSRDGSCPLVHGIYSSVPDVRIVNNVVFRVIGWDIHLWHAATANTVMNNTVYDTGRGGIVVGHGDAGADARGNTGTYVANNIISRTRGVGIAEYNSAGATVSDNTYASNLVWSSPVADLDRAVEHGHRNPRGRSDVHRGSPRRLSRRCGQSRDRPGRDRERSLHRRRRPTAPELRGDSTSARTSGSSPRGRDPLGSLGTPPGVAGGVEGRPQRATGTSQGQPREQTGVAVLDPLDDLRHPEIARAHGVQAEGPDVAAGNGIAQGAVRFDLDQHAGRVAGKMGVGGVVGRLCLRGRGRGRAGVEPALDAAVVHFDQVGQGDQPLDVAMLVEGVGQQDQAAVIAHFPHEVVEHARPDLPFDEGGDQVAVIGRVLGCVRDQERRAARRGRRTEGAGTRDRVVISQQHEVERCAFRDGEQPSRRRDAVEREARMQMDRAAPGASPLIEAGWHGAHERRAWPASARFLHTP